MITLRIGPLRNFFKKLLFSKKMLQIIPWCLLQLLLHHLVWLLNKLHQNISSSWRENPQKPSKKTLKIDSFRVKFSPWRRKLGKNLMIHGGKEIYRRFRISNQIFDSIYGFWDIERSLDTTFAVFNQNWHFMDEYLSLIHISEPTRPY